MLGTEASRSSSITCVEYRFRFAGQSGVKVAPVVSHSMVWLSEWMMASLPPQPPHNPGFWLGSIDSARVDHRISTSSLSGSMFGMGIQQTAFTLQMKMGGNAEMGGKLYGASCRSTR